MHGVIAIERTSPSRHGNCVSRCQFCSYRTGYRDRLLLERKSRFFHANYIHYDSESGVEIVCTSTSSAYLPFSGSRYATFNLIQLASSPLPLQSSKNGLNPQCLFGRQIQYVGPSPSLPTVPPRNPRFGCGNWQPRYMCDAMLTARSRGREDVLPW
jgi:hypothetical protein